MLLLEFLAREGLAPSHSVSRAAIGQSAVKINGEVVDFLALAKNGAELKDGDVVTFGRKTRTFIAPKE
ncbi:MAG: hypothetical protein BWY79_02149 [Actinobacteria bacterium ADurb.Bin444]|nr:MAG: hypothetical protein BWY79_02149 [Actinobacteria bacterium ADurb.Bin444]